MSQPTRFAGDSAVYGLATILERAAGFLLVPILTKSVSQEIYGVWTQITSTAGALSSVVLLGLHAAVVRFLAGDTEEPRATQAFHVMLGIAVFSAGAVFASTVVFAPTWSVLMFGDRDLRRFAPLFGVAIAADALFEIIAGFLRARCAIRKISVYYGARGIGRLLILAILCLVLQVDFWTAALVAVVSQLLLAALVYGWEIAVPVRPKWERPSIVWAELARFCLPLVAYYLLVSIHTSLSRYLVVHYLDVRQVGVYSVNYALVSAVGIVYSVLGFTLFPHLSVSWRSGDREGAARLLRRVAGLYLFAMVPFVVIVSVAADAVIPLIASDAYLAAWQLPVCLGASVLTFGLYQLYIFVTILENLNSLNVLVLAAGISVNVIIGGALIPRGGVVAAAGSLFLANAVVAGISVAMAAWLLPSCFPWRVAIRTVTCGAIMAMLGVGGRALFSGWAGAIAGGSVGLAFYLLADRFCDQSIARELWDRSRAAVAPRLFVS